MNALQEMEKEKSLVGPFVWVTQTGERIAVNQMKTSHLFHSIRMIYNNTCPLGWETRRNFNRYILNRPVSYWKESTSALMKELATRKDLNSGQLAELAFMATNIRIYFARVITNN